MLRLTLRNYLHEALLFERFEEPACEEAPDFGLYATILSLAPKHLHERIQYYLAKHPARRKVFKYLKSITKAI